LIGRVLLWVCVILLLVRGVASVLATPHRSHSVTVTVTQAAPTASPAGGR
jgi:hypothetical protein